MQKFQVEDDDNNIRLDRWFKRNQPDMQHSLLQKLLRKGLVRVNGKKAETSHRVSLGDEITLKMQVEARAEIPYEKKEKPKEVINNPEEELRKMTIWEDKDFVVINKPYGLASQGGTGITISVDDIIKAVDERYRLVHRLDRETTGVLVIAKKPSMAAKFGELLKSRMGMDKIYWALVLGKPEKQQGKIKQPLAKRGEKIERVEVDEENGKFALTEYRILESMHNRFSWLELKPITGRTHQLRVHCAFIGCPIIGDGKYGGTEVFEAGLENKLHLHARRLIVPELGINVTAPLPSHMKEIAPDSD